MDAEGTIEPAAQPVPPRVIEILKGTKPWVKFLAIAGFIMTGLMVLLALIMLVASPFMDEGPIFGVIMCLFYLAAAGLYVFLCMILMRYASSIGRLVAGGGFPAMEEALDHQRRFWRVMGILTIATLCLYALGLLAAVAVGVVVALRG